jgi:2-oxoglutarate ferredoxin oxidoreductase subunit alpha
MPDHVPLRANFGEGYHILVDGQLHDEYGNRVGHLPDKSAQHIQRLCDKINHNSHRIADVESRNIEDAEVVIVSYGSSSRPALRAMKEARAQNLKVGWVKLRTLFPFPDEQLSAIGARAFVVPEMNIGKIVREVKRATGKPCVSLPKLGGELHTPTEILAALKEAM